MQHGSATRFHSGPPSFTLYINDLKTECKSKMYAYDTVLFAHGKTVDEVTQKLTKQIKKVHLL